MSPLKLTPYDPIAAMKARAQISVEALAAEHAAKKDPGVKVDANGYDSGNKTRTRPNVVGRWGAPRR